MPECRRGDVWGKRTDGCGGFARSPRRPSHDRRGEGMKVNAGPERSLTLGQTLIPLLARPSRLHVTRKPLICSLPFFFVRADRHDDGCVLLIVSRGLSQVRGLNDRWVIGVVEADFFPTLKGEAFSCKSELPRLCSYLSGRFGVLSETRKGLPRAPSNLSSDVHGLGRAAHVRCQHPALRY